MEKMLSIGALATRTGLSVSAIRYYESEGLIQVGRNAGGQRRFFRADIRRLSFIMIAQKFGFTIAEIASLLSDLPGGRTPTPADWKKISTNMQTRLDAQIASLVKLRDDLDGCIGCGCLSLPRCALWNAADAAAKGGKGPRYLLGDAPSGHSD